MSVVFNPGDKVRLTRGDEALNGEVIRAFPDHFRIRAFETTASKEFWEGNGWQVSVVPSTPKAEQLPTKPKTVWLDKDGWPWAVTDQGTLLSFGESWRNAYEYVPFTRLDTRKSWGASWANEIADWVERKSGVRQLLGEEIRREFGGAVVDE